MREIIKSLKRKFPRPDGVAITASTGMAACNIGGTTIHSFGGIGLAKESTDQLINKVKRNVKARSRWQRAQVLIVDEVSMVDGDLFDKLAGIASGLRGKAGMSKPFGGIQLVVTGDFFQLPPVATGGATAKFAFEAKEWRNCIHHTVNLTQVFRQKETEFVDMLNEMRFGKLSLKSIQRFRSLSRPPAYPKDGIEPTELYVFGVACLSSGRTETKTILCARTDFLGVSKSIEPTSNVSGLCPEKEEFSELTTLVKLSDRSSRSC